MLQQDALLIERLSRAASIDPALDHQPLLSSRQRLVGRFKSRREAPTEPRSDLKLR